MASKFNSKLFSNLKNIHLLAKNNIDQNPFIKKKNNLRIYNLLRYITGNKHKKKINSLLQNDYDLIKKKMIDKHGNK